MCVPAHVHVDVLADSHAHSTKDGAELAESLPFHLSDPSIRIKLQREI